MQKRIQIYLFTCIVLCLFISSCAYRLGSPEKRVPGGYNLIAVPVFKNSTQEVGVEAFFTQAMIMEIQRSSLASIRDKAESQAIIIGEVVSIDYTADAEVTSENAGFGDLPSGTILAKGYRVNVKVKVSLYRSSDMALLWTGEQTGEKRYPAPVITKQVVNSANVLYNQSAKIQNIQLLSRDMMLETFDRMTENF